MIKYVGLGMCAGTVVFLLVHGVNLIPLLFLGGLIYLLFQTTGLRGMQRKFVSVVPASSPSLVTFNDIGGQASAKRELTEALKFLQGHEKLRKLGIRPLKGILLTGPPGTGKTLLAKASATYTNSVFLATSGSEFIEMYAGVGAQRVREMFRKARDLARQEKRSSAIIFIDELEVLGGKRGSHSSHLEYDQTLNQLLVEMDGISLDDDVKVLIVGATNRSDLLDPALLRPGRFDRVVRVDLPDREGRLQILKLHIRNKPLASDVDIDTIAKETYGFSGAHLESLTNEAAILAMRESKERIEMKHFMEAVDKVIMGEKLDRRPKDSELRRVALHEAGHAIAGEVISPGSVSVITISPRGGALGYVRHSPQDDAYLYPKEKIEEQIAVLLAGAVAEEMHFGSRSTGSANDFETAVSLAKRIVLGGMSTIGIVDHETIPPRTLSRAVGKLLQEQENRVREVLLPRRELMVAVADRLVEKEKLLGEELRRLLYLPEAVVTPEVQPVAPVTPRRTMRIRLPRPLGGRTEATPAR